MTRRSTAKALRARWNKDLTIALYHHHKMIHKFNGIDARQSVDDFCEGWFGTADKTQWKLTWKFA